MQHIPLLVAFITMGGSTVGCASSIEELMIEAKECVAHSTNEQGVIGASKEQRLACWSDYNEQTEIRFKRSERKRKEDEYDAYYQAVCGSGYPVFKSWGGSDKQFIGCGGRYY